MLKNLRLRLAQLLAPPGYVVVPQVTINSPRLIVQEQPTSEMTTTAKSGDIAWHGSKLAKIGIVGNDAMNTKSDGLIGGGG